MKQELLFITKHMPNKIKSSGDLRALNFISILQQKYNVTVIASAADFGTSDVCATGATAIKNSSLEIVQEIIKNKKIEKIILVHWTIAERYLDFIKRISNAEILIDTVDIEFVRLQRKKVYYNSIGKEISDDIQKITNKELTIYRKCDKVITICDFDEEELQKKEKFKTVQVPNIYVNQKVINVKKSNECYTICNWLHQPNIDATIYTCEKIIPKTDLKFYVVGKHPPEEIKKLGNEKVIIHGCEYQLEKFLQNKCMTISPILWGAGLNGKIGEPLSYGIPVVTTSQGALPYGLVHGENVMIGDTEEELLECVNSLLNDEKLLKKISINGKQAILKFTKENISNQVLDNI